MNTLILTSKTNTLFLAFILVAGIITVSSSSSSSFITEAIAEPEYGIDNNAYESKYPSYGKDNSYDKSKKDVIVKKVECDNININTNGLDFSGNSIGDSIAAQAAEEDNGQQLSANAFGNNERNNGFMQNDEDVVVKCIQNNNNGGQEPLPSGGGDNSPP